MDSGSYQHTFGSIVLGNHWVSRHIEKVLKEKSRYDNNRHKHIESKGEHDNKMKSTPVAFSPCKSAAFSHFENSVSFVDLNRIRWFKYL